MKRILSAVVVALLLLGLPAVVSAANPTMTIQGPSSIRAGQTLTVSVYMNGTGVTAPGVESVLGRIQYSAAQLTYKSTGSYLSGWAFDPPSATSGQITYIGIDNALTAPITSNKRLFTVTFTVNASVKPGAEISIASTGWSTSNGTNDFPAAQYVYRVTVAAPLSGNTNLKSLSVTEGAIAPAFDPAVLEYACSVPFETAKATIGAAPADATSRVAISSPALVAGETTDATVTVTAATGATKVYTIHITRGQDPNYVPSDDATLSALSVDGFQLSPGFTPEKDSYVVWLPHEVETLTVAATPTFKRATAAVSGGEALVSGKDNPVTVVVTAENGTTKKTYMIIAKRAEPWDGSVTPSLPVATPTLKPGKKPTPTDSPYQNDENPFPIVPVAIVLVFGIAAGVYLMYLLDKKGRERRSGKS